MLTKVKERQEGPTLGVFFRHYVTFRVRVKVVFVSFLMQYLTIDPKIVSFDCTKPEFYAYKSKGKTRGPHARCFFPALCDFSS